MRGKKTLDKEKEREGETVTNAKKKKKKKILRQGRFADRSLMNNNILLFFACARRFTPF
jgi:hypothetical protein